MMAGRWIDRDAIFCVRWLNEPESAGEYGDAWAVVWLKNGTSFPFDKEAAEWLWTLLKADRK